MSNLGEKEQKNIINELVEKIKMMPNDIEVSLVQLIEHGKIGSKDLLKITFEVFKKCKALGIHLEFCKVGIVGLPYVIPFKKIAEKKEN